MSRIVLACLVAGITGIPGLVVAQSDSTQAGYAYVTYFDCDAGKEYRADEIIERGYKPHYDAAVEAGDIVSWSWLSHFIGGKYRRALVLTTTNMDDLLNVAGALGEAIEDTTPEAGRVFTEICPSHEDYIWETVPAVGGTAAGTARGEVGFSIYWSCDVNREERVDQIMQEVMGPIYDAQIENGNMTTWTWLKHNVGGEWRRLLSVTGPDHAAIMHARAEIVAQLQSGRTERSFTQMNEICPDHVDYMWDIVFETP